MDILLLEQIAHEVHENHNMYLPNTEDEAYEGEETVRVPEASMKWEVWLKRMQLVGTVEVHNWHRL